MPTAVLLRILFFMVFSTMIYGQISESDTTYTLRPNDGISLSIYEEPDLSVNSRILKTGEVSFPLIGSVQLAGLTLADANTKIHDLYAKDYLVDPKITLTVTGYTTEFISVIGAVNKPGQIAIPVSGQLDLVSAMITSGGITEYADANGIQLVRASGASTTFSMSSIQGEAGRTRLGPGDRIIVRQSYFIGKQISVIGQVNKPGPIAFPANGKLDLINAIAFAGGLSPLANPKKVTINRKGQITIINFKEISQRGDRPILLEPDDVITVAERLF